MIKYEDETYLTTEEAARFLGKTVTAFRQFIYRNTIPRRKLGGRLYFPVKKLNGYYANRADYKHFESTGLAYEEVYTMDELLKIFLTTRQHVYSWVSRHNIKRYKDNTGRTLYNKVQINKLLDRLKEENTDDL